MSFAGETAKAPVGASALRRLWRGGGRAAGLLAFLAILLLGPRLALGAVAKPAIQYAPSSYAFTVGTAIPAIAPISSGGPVASWSIKPALPGGLSFSTASGTVTGTPAVAIPATVFTVKASNAGGSASASLTLQVHDLAPAITYEPSAYTLYLNVPVPAIAPVSSGGAVLSYAVAPALPKGLKFDARTGQITGKPAVATPETGYQVTAANRDGTATAGLVLSVAAAPPSISYSPSTAVFQLGVAIASLVPANTGGKATGFTVTPALPAGLWLNPNTGVITGTPTAAAAAADYTVTATNPAGSGTAVLTLTVAGGAPAGLSYAVNPAVYTKGVTITTNLPTCGGGTPTSYSASPGLPARLELDPATGEITGTPDAVAAQATYTITASNAGGSTSVALVLTVNDVPPSISYPASSYTFTTGEAITTLAPTNTGGAVVSWSITPTGLAGLTFDPATGEIKGTPNEISIGNYTVTATNSGGSGTAQFSILVNPPAPTLSLQPASQSVMPGATATFEAAATGSGSLGYQWQVNGSPIPGATEASYTTPAATLADNGSVFRVVVSDVFGGTVTSSEAVLTIIGAAFARTGDLSAPRVGLQAALLGNGQVLLAGGFEDYQYKVIRGIADRYDPATGHCTATTGAMATPRGMGTATLLGDGKVLLAGGMSAGNGYPAAAELYDPVTDAFTATGPMDAGFYGHTATRLGNGKVLITGGSEGTGARSAALLYDPETGQFTATGSMAETRFWHSATLLPSGKVLVAGGTDTSSYRASAELYDPATGEFTPTGSMKEARFGHSATLLPDGTVLVAGGATPTLLATTERYDPGTLSFTGTESMAVPRALQTATLLPNGKVLLAGGMIEGNAPGADAELYDPATGTCANAGRLITARYLHGAVLLPTGKVLLAGGFSGTPLASQELYDPQDPSPGLFTATGDLTTNRVWDTATLLPTGNVLLAGGIGGGAGLASAELYRPAQGTCEATGSLAAIRAEATATLLPNGKVLVAGGHYGARIASAEVYDPAAGTFAGTGSMGQARCEHTATLLANGKVLVAGGSGSSYTPIAGAELYDPAGTGTFAATGSLAAARYTHTATLLADGTVLVAGGMGDGRVLLTGIERYDPATGQFTASGTLVTGRYGHTATRLPDGRVLLAGGTDDEATLASAELYDPVTGQSTATGSMAAPRNWATATLLPDGRVLVAGGTNDDGFPVAGELYDPSSGTFATTGMMVAPRYSHTALLLPDGRVYLSGGSNTTGILKSAELYQ